MSKLQSSLKEAIRASGLRDGMTISFHHHLRNGDLVINYVMDTLAEMGFRGLTINASSLHKVHAPMVEHIRSGLVSGIITSFIDRSIGRYLTENPMEQPVIFETHGGRAGRLSEGKDHIDVAFLTASASDCMGNCSGKYGKAPFGSFGYGIMDAACADSVIIITDTVMEYPLVDFSIPETQVDYVVELPSIGDPAGIATGPIRPSNNPAYLKIAEYAAKAIDASGLLKDGFSFQMGSSGIALSVASFVKEIMLEKGIKGGFGLGGITGALVDLLESGCLSALMDVQDFDIRATQSVRDNPRHHEVDGAHYAYMLGKGCAVKQLDAAILGATQIDADFNVNVHTDSFGRIMGGSGGHSDIAAGCKLAIITTPLIRGRIPIVVEHVNCITTPGNVVDLLVTQYGLAVNPQRRDLKERLQCAGLPVCEIADLVKRAERMTGKPAECPRGERVAAIVHTWDGSESDRIFETQVQL